MTSFNDILTRNHVFYEFFIRRKIFGAEQDISAEELLKRIGFITRFIWRNHAGYYFDGRLENKLLNFGRDLCRHVDGKRIARFAHELSPREENFSLLHVATELGAVGGHTRVLYQILKRHKDGNQLLILTDQAVKDIPQWFVEKLGGSVKMMSLDRVPSPFERACVLRHISASCKTIILYHHPYDVVPVMAFSHDQCPPVLIENHAHSWFWFGASVADLVFSHSKFHQNFTTETRPVGNSYYLPCTQIDDLEDALTREDKIAAKSHLGLSADTVCIITIGTPEKFIPNNRYNFFKTAKKILERFEKVKLYVIGIGENPDVTGTYGLDSERIHFVGAVADPTSYYKAADICLDALPQPSLGGTWFSTLIGMSCPFFKYGQGNVFTCRDFYGAKLYGKHIGHVKNEKDYLDRLEILVNSPDLRMAIAQDFRDNYLKEHSPDVIVRNINRMLEFTSKLTHRPHPIPDGLYHRDADSAEIAATSSIQNLADAMEYFAGYLCLRDKIALLSRIAAKGIFWGEIFHILRKSWAGRIRSLPAAISGWRRSLWPG